MTIAVPTSGGWTFDAQLEDEDRLAHRERVTRRASAA
jgi:hypothetical protein